MVESTPTPEWRLRQYVTLGWAKSIDEAKRKIDFQVALGLALMPPMFTIVPLVFVLFLHILDALAALLSSSPTPP